jgi:dipeptidyl-peptidase-4
MNYIINLFLLFFCSIIFAQKTVVSIEDIWQDYKFYPNSIDEFHWVGLHDYAQLENKNTFRPRIAMFSVEDGRETSVLLQPDKYENFIKNVLKSRELPFKGTKEKLDEYQINDFDLSSDKNHLLLQLGSEQFYRYSSKSYLLLYELDQSRFSFIPTNEKVFYPNFSPDGECFSFIMSNNLYVYDIKLETIRQLTFDGEKNKIINGMSDWVYEEEFELTRAYEWSEDSKSIAFLSFDESAVNTYDVQLWENALYPLSYTYKYPKAGEENSRVKVFSVAIENGEIELLKDYSGEDIYIPRLYWNGKDIVVLKLNRLQNRLELIQFNTAQNNQVEVIYSEKADKNIEWKDHFFFKDDGFVISNEKNGFRHLYYYNYKGKLIKQLTNGQWGIDEVFSCVNDEFYFSSTEGNIFERNIYKVDLLGKKKIIVNLEGCNSVHVSPDGEFLVNHNSSFQVPDNYSVLDSEGSFMRELESNQELYYSIKNFKVPVPEYFVYENSNGDSLHAYFLKPVDFDSTKKYPVLMYVYGGPGFQVLKNEYDGFNYFWHSHLTQKGYIIALVDVRGTGGRGRLFREQTYGKLGELETNDISQIAEHIKLMPFVDEDRMGIWGWSYGGYLSSLLAMQGGTFNAVIAVAPVTNWRFYDSVYAERYLGLPQDNTEGYDWNSPINLAEGLDSKYLLIHGTGDDNVHLQHSIFMQKALINANKQFDVFYYPDRNHGIYGGNTRLHLYHLMTDFLLENL